jgi:hypothetical protein
MAWVIRPYKCNSATCGHEWEDMVERSEEDKQVCPECGCPASWMLCAPNVATFSLLDKAGQTAALKKRSRDHTRKELKKDPSQAKGATLK